MSRRTTSSLSNFILSSVPARIQKWKKNHIQIGKLNVITWIRGDLISVDHIVSSGYSGSDMEESHKPDERIDIGNTQTSIDQQKELKRNIHDSSNINNHSNRYIPPLQIEGDDNTDSDTGMIITTEEEGYSRDTYEDDMSSQDESS